MKKILFITLVFLTPFLYAENQKTLSQSQRKLILQLLPQQELSQILQSKKRSSLMWNIGDELNYEVKMGVFGKIGTLQKKVTDIKNGIIILDQKISIPGQNDILQFWIDQNSAEIVKFIRNGKEEAIEDEENELMDQKNEVIVVPAGKFDSEYTLSKNKNGDKLELWTNESKTCLDGILKQVIYSTIAPIELELVSFI